MAAEVRRLEALGATRWDLQTGRGWDFWVLRDPWGNESCVLQPEFPDSWPAKNPGTTHPRPADHTHPGQPQEQHPDLLIRAPEPVAGGRAVTAPARSGRTRRPW